MNTTRRPNIILILIDDLGARDLGAFGSTFYETPRLDRLAASGMRFDRAYASCPVCSPTRASILTGKYPARVGITQWIGGALKGRLSDVPYLHYLPRSEFSLAAALKESGYQTWHVGKWHLGDEPFFPEHHGFDVNIAGRHVGHPPGPNGYRGPYNIPGFTGPEGEYLTDRLTEESLRLIRRRDPTKPFFLNLWHYAVHTPIQAPPELVEKYRAKAARLGLDRIDPIAPGEVLALQSPPGQPRRHLSRRLVQSNPAYAAMLENLDTNIGKLLDTLDELGLTQDTIVVFTSDNGGLSTAEGAPTCNHPLAEGKGWCYEGGNRVCQFISWPGEFPAGQVSVEPVTSTDFYPTLLEAAGLPARPLQHCDGVSLTPLLRGTATTLDRKQIFWHYPHYSNQGGRPAAAVVEGNWKLIWHFEDDRVELFDLARDVSESTNLADRHADVVERLRGSLTDWQDQVRAVLPQPNPEWQAWLESQPRPTVANNACD
jgi:arylsulfatase A-like enzyme